MDKRLMKRHKRQVRRANARTRLSEPDLRTPEQLQAAREASRSVAARNNDPHAFYSTPRPQIPGPPAGEGAPEEDVAS
jgi:hypothetical protein